MTTGESAARTEQLGNALAAVRQRIDAACASAQRDPASVRLLAVTKTFPAADVAALIDLGLREFGESKDQEAARKAAEVARLRPAVPVRWLMVGRLQRNKASSVARWAAEVQSVDSLRLADSLAKAVAVARDRGERTEQLDVQVQVSMDADPARGGCPVDDVGTLLDNVARRDELRLRGLMTVAPLGADKDVTFARFAALHAAARACHPGLTELSVGMSGDLEPAITHGSTCVRVGTALLGGRQLASFE